MRTVTLHLENNSSETFEDVTELVVQNGWIILLRQTGESRQYREDFVTRYHFTFNPEV